MKTLFAGYLLTGICAVLLGPLIPALRPLWGVGLEAAGTLFLAQFLVSSLGAVVSGFRLRWSLVGGYLAIAAGLGGFATGSWALARPAAAVSGLGFGLVISATNLLVAHKNPERRGASLAWINLAWGFGAVASPLLFLAAERLGPPTVVPGALAVLAMLVAMTLAARPAITELPAMPPAAGPGAPAPTGLLPLLAIAAMLFVYVGSENALGGWLVELSDELSGRHTDLSLLVGSSFWGALLGGRALTPALLRRLSEGALFLLSLALAIVGTGMLVASSSSASAAAGALVTGFGLAPLFPLAIALLAERTAASRSRGSGWVLACGGLGGALLPWLTARIGAAGGDLRLGFWVPLGGLVLLAGLYFGLARGSGGAAASGAPSDRSRSR